MSTDREREALARLIDPRFGRIVTGVPRTFTDMGDAQALEAADRIIATGWMPRPEPGGPWRLLTTADRIEAGDQSLADDCKTWIEPDRWALGMQYNPCVLVPMRRRAALGTGERE